MDINQTSSILENISIQGRMAYAICAFENYVLGQNDPRKQWKLIFKQLWSFPEFLEEWFYKTPEYFPSSILEFRKYSSSTWDYIDEITFNNLHDFYTHTLRIFEIDMLMTCIHQILSVEMNGSHNEEMAVRAMDKFLRRALSYQTNLPDINLFTRYPWDQNARFGKPILRSEIPIPYQFD